jgi:hypothetical protein
MQLVLLGFTAPPPPSPLTAYLDHRAQTCGPRTLALYRHILSRVERQLGGRPPDAASVAAYLRQYRAAAPDTQRNIYRALKAYCRWLVDAGHLAADPFAGPLGVARPAPAAPPARDLDRGRHPRAADRRRPARRPAPPLGRRRPPGARAAAVAGAGPAAHRLGDARRGGLPPDVRPGAGGAARHPRQGRPPGPRLHRRADAPGESATSPATGRDDAPLFRDWAGGGVLGGRAAGHPRAPGAPGRRHAPRRGRCTAFATMQLNNGHVQACQISSFSE